MVQIGFWFLVYGFFSRSDESFEHIWWVQKYQLTTISNLKMCFRAESSQWTGIHQFHPWHTGPVRPWHFTSLSVVSAVLMDGRLLERRPFVCVSSSYRRHYTFHMRIILITQFLYFYFLLNKFNKVIWLMM